MQSSHQSIVQYSEVYPTSLTRVEKTVNISADSMRILYTMYMMYKCIYMLYKTVFSPVEPADRSARVQQSLRDFFAGEIPMSFEFMGAVLAKRQTAVPQVVAVATHLELASCACVKNVHVMTSRGREWLGLPILLLISPILYLICIIFQCKYNTENEHVYTHIQIHTLIDQQVIRNC